MTRLEKRANLQNYIRSMSSFSPYFKHSVVVLFNHTKYVINFSVNLLSFNFEFEKIFRLGLGLFNKLKPNQECCV